MTETDTTPTGQLDIDGKIEPEKIAPDVKPKAKRPTTRQGRAAKAEAAARARAAKAADPTTKQDKKPRAATTRARTSPLATRLNGAIGGLGMSITVAGSVVGNEPLTADGYVITQNAEPVSQALEKLAQNDPRVRDALEKMLTAGAYSGIIVAILPVVVGILANHNMIPAGLVAAMPGTTAPMPTPEAGGLPDEAFGPAA